MIEPVQSAGPTSGDLLNLVGIGLLLLATFFYIQKEQTKDDQIEEEARRKFTLIVITFIFYTVVAYIHWGDADSWVVQMGDAVDAYFEEMASVFAQGTEESTTDRSLLDRVANGLQTIGLIAYVALFGATSIVGKTPVKIYEVLFGD